MPRKSKGPSLVTKEDYFKPEKNDKKEGGTGVSPVSPKTLASNTSREIKIYATIMG
jgi:hypothetical protein